MLNCLIIEDEPLAAEILQDYIEEVPNLKLVSICRDVISASELMRINEIDVLFVDVHLPKINGIDFIKTIQNRYQVILTTAYHQYAMDGYDLNVVDYLLKPIDFTRFLQAINKLQANEGKSQNQVLTPLTNDSFHFFNVDKRQVKVFHRDILYIESLKEYVRIHSLEISIMTKVPIGEIETLLGSNDFIRIHKSYVVNLEKITAFSANEIEIGMAKLPIGRTYKEVVQKKLEFQ